MRITEVITEDADVSGFAKEVGSDVAHIPKGIWGRATDTAKAAFDPDTYVKAGSDARDATERGIEFAKKDPKGAAKYAAAKGFETADDFMRATANAMTFGYADKLAAKVNSDSDDEYEKEKEKEFNKSGAAMKRSPFASVSGDIAGTVLNPAFGAGMKIGGIAAKELAPSVVKALKYAPNRTTTDVAKNVAKGTVKTPAEIAAGVAGDKLASRVAKAQDATNPHLRESARLKELIKYRF
jgi:hypothetical protein